jgi:hypothetical protein
MPNSKEVVLAYVWGDGDVACEIEVNGQPQKFAEFLQVLVGHQWNVENKGKLQHHWVE